MLGWLKRLFTHTAETPPRIDPIFSPIGLDRPDPLDMLESESTAPQIESLPVKAAPSAAPTPRKTDSEATWGTQIDDDVYGLTFVIEYRGADERLSRRRIMLQSIFRRDDGRTYLRAVCFERNALRAFRLDRVIRVIDADGEIFDDAIVYLTRELRVHLPDGPIAAPADPPKQVPAQRQLAATPLPGQSGRNDDPGYAQRRVARDGLRILIALARSDGMLHPAEVDVVVEYIGQVCHGAGVDCVDADRAALQGYLKRQRPSRDVLEECLIRLDAGPDEGKLLLLDFADRVIDADGLRHEAEHLLIAEIRAQLQAGPAAPFTPR